MLCSLGHGDAPGKCRSSQVPGVPLHNLLCSTVPRWGQVSPPSHCSPRPHQDALGTWVRCGWEAWHCRTNHWMCCGAASQGHDSCCCSPPGDAGSMCTSLNSPASTPRPHPQWGSPPPPSGNLVAPQVGSGQPRTQRGRRCRGGGEVRWWEVEPRVSQSSKQVPGHAPLSHQTYP